MIKTAADHRQNQTEILECDAMRSAIADALFKTKQPYIANHRPAMRTSASIVVGPYLIGSTKIIMKELEEAGYEVTILPQATPPRLEFSWAEKTETAIAA